MVRTYAAETATTSPVKVMSVNPGPMRTRMRAQAMPGEDPETLKTPDVLSPKLVELCSPRWTETGCLFDFPTGKLLRFQAPAEAPVEKTDQAPAGEAKHVPAERADQISANTTDQPG